MKKVKPIKKKKIKLTATDGLGPYEIKKIRNALRQVWHRSKARRLCVERCIGADKFFYCEHKDCKKKTPQIKIDHIKKVGEVDGGFIERLFVPSNKLQGLCKPCHDAKTKKENADAKKTKKIKEHSLFFC